MLSLIEAELRARCADNESLRLLVAQWEYDRRLLGQAEDDSRIRGCERRSTEAIMNVRKSIEEGQNMTDPLRACGIFPNMVVQMIGVGEQTGALDAMLSKIADFYEQEVDAAIANLLSLMEPAMIMFLGVTIGTILIAMYLPLFTLIGKLAGAH